MLPRILHLEDNSRDAELARAALSAEGLDCEIVRVRTRPQFIAGLESGGFDGHAALTLAREKCPAVPFLFISGTIGEERAIEALKRAQFLQKPYSLEKLLTALHDAVMGGAPLRDAT
jgi:CheY-like chemotaxis protein